MSHPQIIRIALIFQRLAKARRPITADDFASEMEISTKTVNRDIECLRRMGCEIRELCRGNIPHRGYWLVTKCRCPFCSKP